MTKDRRKAILAAYSAMSIAEPYLRMAANSSWTYNGSGSWSISTNWLGGCRRLVPTATSFKNDFANRAITRDLPATIGTLRMGNSGTAATTSTQIENLNIALGDGIFGLTSSDTAEHTQSNDSNYLRDYSRHRRRLQLLPAPIRLAEAAI